MGNGLQRTARGIVNNVAIVAWYTRLITGLMPKARSSFRYSGMPEPLQPPAGDSNSPKTMIKYFNYVVFRDIEDHLKLGWQVSIPNGPSHLDRYGIVMVWLCDCLPVREKSKTPQSGN